MNNCKVSVIIPVLNGGTLWKQCIKAISNQIDCDFDVLVIDSGSDDGSAELADEAGFDVVKIDKRDFDHGGTRQMGAHSLSDSDVIIYLTQDAILEHPRSLARLVEVFADPKVGMAYGRQLPREGASPIEAHARIFNYPAESSMKCLDDVPRLGIKAAFTSNSFAAYRTEALFHVGGFPESLILGEDMIVAARMLQSHWTVAYVASACVKHSHAYTIAQEFRRYFDIGVLHHDEHWILEDFGKPEGEGARFIASELAYLRRESPWLIPSALTRTIAKLSGYKLGMQYHRLPKKMRRLLSMHRLHWDHKSSIRTDACT